MTKTVKKLRLQVVDAPPEFTPLIGSYLLHTGDGLCGLTRDPSLALSYDMLDDAVSAMMNQIHSPFTFAPVIVTEEVSA